MGDGETGRVAELERKLRTLEHETAQKAAALREELMRVQRAQALESQLHALETRHAVEAAQLRSELERARGGVPVREPPPLRREPPGEPGSSERAPQTPARPHTPLGLLVLQFQLPTLLVGVCLLPMPLFAGLFAAPIAVAMLLSAFVSWALERRHGAGAPPTSLWLHQIGPFALLQPVILFYAYFAGTFRLHGARDLRVDEFAVALAILEGGYLVAVALPVALIVRAARAAGRP